MHIVITSKNPVKRNATHEAFQKIFPDQELTIEEISTESGVSDQPMNETETLTGAKNRVQNAIKLRPSADYYVGIEGGIELKNGDMEAFAWVFIQDKFGQTGKGRTGTFFLPKKIIELIHQGKELGEADDIVFNQTNSKQKGGTIGTLTGGKIDRTEYYIHAVIFALIPFINSDLY